MHHRSRLVPLIALASLAACAEAPTTPQSSLGAGPMLSVAAEGAPAQHVVVFKNRAPADFAARVDALGGMVEMNHELGIAVVSGMPEANAAALLAQTSAQHVEAMPDFRLVEPAAIGEPRLTALELGSESIASVANPAGAILFADQWNLRAVNAPAAWAAGRLGDASVRVAILDTGIDYLLPDLNGLVDLTRSASFVAFDNQLAAQRFPTRHNTTDLHYHGTNVATQVSSKAFAYAGVTSKTTLMSVKTCSANTALGCPGLIQGFLFAIDNGADVINMSLGGWFAKSDYPGTIAAYNRLMNYARQKGVTVVVAAGNSSIDLDRNTNVPLLDSLGNVAERVHIPSFFTTYCDAAHVICVAATGRNDAPASYTNFGRSAIDVSAPGGDAGAWVYALCPQSSLLFNCRGGYYSLGVAGTSQAAPHVAGLAALAVQDVGRDPAKVKAYIRNSADAIDGGNSAHHGKGRINVGRAVGAN